MSVRTRFAPSPTGFLHIGGARTALFCYLFARKHGGEFILRIEDTDRERSTQASVDAILDGMNWLGLEHDEGPHFQTHRFDRYREVIDQLLESGHAYHCTCSREELDREREAQKARGDKPRYSGKCRNGAVDPGVEVTPVVRFRNPQQGEVSWNDAVKGTITVSNDELDDLVIARSDGSPTYNLTVVVDDIDMAITHVVRGDDHVNNTPRQINIYQALGAQLPVFAHVPMILGDDGSRLSKRHGAVSVMSYRDAGYLPCAVLNYLVRLGWSHGDQELFSMPEMISLFDLDQVNRSASTFNTEKLNWVNQHYIQNLPADDIVPELSWHMKAKGIDVDQGPCLTVAIELLRERCNTLAELAEQAGFLYIRQLQYDEKAAAKQFKPAAAEPMRCLLHNLEQLEQWQAELIHDVIAETVEQLGVGFGKVGQPLRLALTGRSNAPANDQIMLALGRQTSLDRIRLALDIITAED